MTAAGYVLARVLLGTHYLPVHWSPADEDNDPFEPVGRMDLNLSYPEAWSDFTIDLIDSVVLAAGHEDPERSDPIGSAAAMAFDHGVAIALIEHDRSLGRFPDAQVRGA